MQTTFEVLKLRTTTWVEGALLAPSKKLLPFKGTRRVEILKADPELKSCFIERKGGKRGEDQTSDWDTLGAVDCQAGTNVKWGEEMGFWRPKRGKK